MWTCKNVVYLEGTGGLANVAKAAKSGLFALFAPPWAVAAGTLAHLTTKVF